MKAEAERKINPSPWKGLKGKQAPWLRAYLNEGDKQTFMNGTASAREAGYKANSVKAFTVIASENMSKLSSLIDEWMDDFGLSEAALKRKLKSLTEAKQTKFVKLKGAVNGSELDDNSKVIVTTGLIQHVPTEDGIEEVYGDGETLLAVEEEALGIQTKTLELGMKYKKMLTEKIEIVGMDGIAERILANREKIAADV